MSFHTGRERLLFLGAAFLQAFRCREHLLWELNFRGVLSRAFGIFNGGEQLLHVVLGRLLLLTLLDFSRLCAQEPRAAHHQYCDGADAYANANQPASLHDMTAFCAAIRVGDCFKDVVDAAVDEGAEPDRFVDHALERLAVARGQARLVLFDARWRTIVDLAEFVEQLLLKFVFFRRAIEQGFHPLEQLAHHHQME